MLEDILSSVMSSVAPSRLSAYLAFKSGLPFASTFTYVDSTHLSSTVTVAYESLLYHEVPLMSSRPSIKSSSLILQTSTTQYLIHPGHPVPQLLSEHEVCNLYVVSYFVGGWAIYNKSIEGGCLNVFLLCVLFMPILMYSFFYR